MIVKEVAEKQRSIIRRSEIQLGSRIGRGDSGEVFRGTFRGTEGRIRFIDVK